MPINNVLAKNLFGNVMPHAACASKGSKSLPHRTLRQFVSCKSRRRPPITVAVSKRWRVGKTITIPSWYLRMSPKVRTDDDSTEPELHFPRRTTHAWKTKKIGSPLSLRSNSCPTANAYRFPLHRYCKINLLYSPACVCTFRHATYNFTRQTSICQYPNINKR